MKFLCSFLGLASVGLFLASAAQAQQRVVQSRDAERELYLLWTPRGPIVQDDERSFELELRKGTEILALEPLREGWVGAGIRAHGGESRLELVARVGGRIEPLPAPADRRGRMAHQPVPLIEEGRLVGLAWLQGEAPADFEVRAAEWDGRRWGDPVTVSSYVPEQLESQLALSATVAADGSWLLVWSATEGDHDEIFWARREVNGSWSPRHKVNTPNAVPDIQPTIVVTHSSVLVAWNELHEGHYRVRLARLVGERWVHARFTGPPGSISPRLMTTAEGALLSLRSVLGGQWMAIELDAYGAPRRAAAIPATGYEPPVLLSAETEVAFSWPAASALDPTLPSPRNAARDEPETESALETRSTVAPWLPWEPDLLESEDEARALAIQPGGGPAGAESGAVVYRAFGDSVTRGTGDPAVPGFLFDTNDDGEAPPPAYQACAQSADPFAIRCAYGWRLEDTLDGAFTSDVANDGSGGETTAGGLSRIDSVLAGGGQVIAIMEGSNDISTCTIPTATIRDNISDMVDKATTAGFDSIIASPPKRRRTDASNNWIPLACETTLNADLRTKLQTLAANKNRAFADVYDSIDPNLGPTDYWNVFGAPNGDPVGHPDISGNAKIEPKFSAAILADSLLGPPNALTPVGDVTASPTFTWSKQAGARLYRLSVTGPGAPPASWHDSLAICPASLCSVNLGALAAGSHTWQVEGKNLRGLGSFSAAKAFDVYTVPPAAAPATGEPIGNCDPDCFDLTPPVFLTFEFLELADATDYELELSSSAGVISVESFSASAICAGGNCAATSGTGLPAGDFDWRVRGKNPAGNGPWSSKTAFSIYDAPPPAPELWSPLGDTFDDTPVYRWKNSGVSADYRLDVPGAYTLLYSASSVCDGSLCEVIPAPALALGGHTWRVRGEHPILGNGAYTAFQPFTVLDCSLFPTNLSLDASDTGSNTYRACPGSVTSLAGFVVASGETVVLHGMTSVVVEEIEVENGATLTFLTN